MAPARPPAPPLVAVTGATGFVGRAVVRRLVTVGWRVRALARPASAPRLDGLPVELVRGDLEDAAALARLVTGAEAIVHCAGAIRGLTATDFRRVNVEGLRRLVAAIRWQGAQGPRSRLLAVSSLAARRPELSAYAASKRAAEDVLAAAADVAWTIVRPPAVYGPGDQALRPLWQVLRLGILPVLGPSRARFSLLYVDDLAEAVAQLLRAADHAGRTFELHDGRSGGYGWADVREAAGRCRGRDVRAVRIPRAALVALALVQVAVQSARGRRPLLTPGKVRELLHHHWVCDNAELTGATGWTPRIDLDEGLRRTLSGLNGRPVPETGEESHAHHAELR
jgi:2-alkyl-3-oxoalkanoate reductase